MEPERKKRWTESTEWMESEAWDGMDGEDESADRVHGVDGEDETGPGYMDWMERAKRRLECKSGVDGQD